MHDPNPYVATFHPSAEVSPPPPSSPPPSPPPATRYERLRAAFDNVLGAYTAATLNPKPSYAIDGQSVQWDDYLKMLQDQLDFLERQLALVGDPEFQPVVIKTRGV